MGNSFEYQSHDQSMSLISVDKDQFGENRSIGVINITFKVTPKTSDGIFIIENTFHAKGGPAKHFHYDQDEWFYVVEGEFLFEIGEERFKLQPGDSVLAPRKIPHVWAYTGNNLGRKLIAFLPAGKMEAFFREVTRANAMPPLDPELWSSHGMELIGPPLNNL